MSEPPVDALVGQDSSDRVIHHSLNRLHSAKPLVQACWFIVAGLRARNYTGRNELPVRNHGLKRLVRHAHKSRGVAAARIIVLVVFIFVFPFHPVGRKSTRNSITRLRFCFPRAGLVALALAIRSAIGARPADTFRLLLGRAAKPILAGWIAGEFASASLARALTGVLYQVNARAPLTFAGAALLLAIGALATCVMPTRRALRLDPMAILRSE